MRLGRAIAVLFDLRDRSHGRLRSALWTAFVAAGFIFQGLLPGIDLALRGEGFPGALGLTTGICHSPLGGEAARDAARLSGGEEEQAQDHGCCLVCQAASPAKGAVPSPTFKVPTAGTAGLRFAAIASTRIDGPASRSRLPRGPPAALPA